jgi:hypothetical protein
VKGNPKPCNVSNPGLVAEQHAIEMNGFLKLGRA